MCTLKSQMLAATPLLAQIKTLHRLVGKGSTAVSGCCNLPQVGQPKFHLPFSLPPPPPISSISLSQASYLFCCLSAFGLYHSTLHWCMCVFLSLKYLRERENKKVVCAIWTARVLGQGTFCQTSKLRHCVRTSSSARRYSCSSNPKLEAESMAF